MDQESAKSDEEFSVEEFDVLGGAQESFFERGEIHRATLKIDLDHPTSDAEIETEATLDGGSLNHFENPGRGIGQGHLGQFFQSLLGANGELTLGLKLSAVGFSL